MAEFTITQPNGTDLRAYGTDTAALPNGNIVVVWDQTSSDANIEETIGIRVLAADGTAVSNEFFTQSATAAAPPNRFEDGPEVIAIDDTHFVVAWSSFNNTNGVYEIHARTVTLSGATLSFGADKVISDTTKDGTGQLSLARMDNGNIAFAWGEFAADYLSSRAVVRIMDSSLNPLSPITQVSQNTAAGIGFVEIVANGNALSVAWKQNAGVGSIPTFAYQFTANANGTIPALTLGDITVRSGQTQLHDFVELANGDLLVLTIGGPDIAGTLNDGDRLFGTIYNSTLTSVVKATFQINQNEQDTGVVYSEAFAFAGGGFGIVFDQEADALVPNDNNRDVFYRIYNNAYDAVGSQVALHLPNGADLRDLQPSGVVTSADGDVTFVWERKPGAAGNEVLVGQQITNLEPNPPAPTVDTNTGSSLNEGGLDVIATTELETNDTDTADSSLVYTVTTATTNGSLWVDSDGSGTINGGEAALGLSGTFTQANIAAGLLKYRHNGGETTTDSFGFSVTDGTTPVTGQTFSFTVTPVNDPSVAVDDSFTTSETSILGAGLNVFNANPTTPDSDPDSALAVTEVNNSAANVGNQILLASGALLTLNSNGTFSYNPNGAFEDLPATAQGVSPNTRNDSFTYTVAGGDTATVAINVTGVDNNDTINGNSDNDFVQTLNGGVGNDRIFGNGSPGDNQDILNGEAGDDQLTGGARADTLNGGADNDLLAGGLGNDTLNGGTGSDTADWSDATGVVSVTLDAAGNGSVTAAGIDTDTFSSIENMIGGSAGDTLTGNAEDNVLRGRGGNDTLDGAGGRDIVDWSDATAAIAVTLNATGSGVLTAAGIDTDTYSNFEGMTGGSAGDTLAGNAGVNALSGSGGADILYGLAGNDTLRGGLGIDKLKGGANDDTIFGDDGNDIIEGHGGTNVMHGGTGNDTFYIEGLNDRAVEAAGAGSDLVYAFSNFTLEAGSEVEWLIARAAGLTVEGNEFANRFTAHGGGGTLNGGGGNDFMTGGAGIDTLNGGGGNDKVYGEGGDDTLTPGLGFDQFTGGAGNDTFRFAVADFESRTATGLYDTIYDYSRDAPGGNFDRIQLQGAAADYVFQTTSSAAYLRIVHVATVGTVYVTTAVTTDPAVLAAQVEYFA